MQPAATELKFDRDAFLAQYWQRSPVLLRGAIAPFEPPLNRHQLAGLAMEDDVESRIVSWQHERWQLSHGPFRRRDYERDSPWTLLVQAVDHHVPAVADLRRLIDFIPQWRIDDVMVSYAVDGGSVGPHFDNYDVFLLQGEGERHWKLGQHCDSSSALIAHDELSILSEFEQQQDYVLGPGDMLYIPPGVAHWGVARGDCTTFSIGFRAPRVSDLVSRWVDQLLEHMDTGQFYTDASLVTAGRPGEIRPGDRERVLAQLQHALAQQVDDRWFGELVTEPRYEPIADDDDLAEAKRQLHHGDACIVLSPAAKLAWQQDHNAIRVFANGDSRAFPAPLLPHLTGLCDTWRMSSGELRRLRAQPQGVELLDYLLENSCIHVE